jgi:hypothetical protein
MSIALLVKTLLDAGVDSATIVAAVEAVERPAIDEQAERRRAADRERKREAKILRNSAESAETPSPQVSKVSPHTPFPNLPNPNPSKKDPKGSQKGSPLSELSAVLSPETAQAVVEHRQRMRKPLTAYAAKMLAAKFAACSDPNAAADAMIANGWQGFDQAWMQRGHSPPRAKDYTQAANEIIEEMREHERAKSQGIERDVQLFPGLSGRPETAVEYLPAPVVRIVGRGGD